MLVFADTDTRAEFAIHVEFVAWLKEAHPEILCIHPKNEGRRNWAQVRTEKQLGALNKGAPDFILIGQKPMAIELKNSKGKLSASQKEWLTKAENQGVAVAVCHGANALKVAVKYFIKLNEA